VSEQTHQQVQVEIGHLNIQGQVELQAKEDGQKLGLCSLDLIVTQKYREGEQLANR
jgi:hypothetical protein